MQKRTQRKIHCQRRKNKEPRQKDIPQDRKIALNVQRPFNVSWHKDFLSRTFLELTHFSYAKIFLKSYGSVFTYLLLYLFIQFRQGAISFERISIVYDIFLSRTISHQTRVP